MPHRREEIGLPFRSARAAGASGIFLTGATGLVGGLLLRRLRAEHPDRPVYALVRDRSAASGLHGAIAIWGDITEPDLGLGQQLYAHLCRSVDTVVHCAAATRFTLPLEASRRANVEGTANVLALARRVARLRMLLQISSTYVAGRRSGPLEEAPLRDPAGWFSPYEQSKFEAEQLIREQGAGLPWTIARLSTLVGDSRTGQVAQSNYFHQLLRLVPRNPFPVIPGTPGATVDVVADDWVADALLAILRAPVASGRFLHLCAGPSQALPAGEMVEHAFELHRRRHRGPRAATPSFVSLAEFQSFAESLKRRGDEKAWRMSELLLLYLPHLEVQQSFLNDGSTALLRTLGVTPLQTREFLPRILQACLAPLTPPAGT